MFTTLLRPCDIQDLDGRGQWRRSRWPEFLDDGRRSTELCWRTPAGTGCIDDSFRSPDVGVIPTDGAAILLARPALIPIEPPPIEPLAYTHQLGPNPTTVDVTLSDGSEVAVLLQTGRDFGVSVGRVQLAPGVTVVSATSR